MNKLFNKRFVAMLLTLAMVLSLVPMAAVALEEETEVEGLVYNKTATLENDGTYTIDLSAYSTGTTTTTSVKTGVPLDIVLVLDQSGSMAYTSSSNSWASSKENTRYYKLQQALTTMMTAIADNAKEYNITHRVAMVGFAGAKSTGDSDGSLCHNSADSNSSYWKNTGIFIDGKLKNYGNNTDGSLQLTATDYQSAMESIGTNGAVPTDLTTAIGNVAANSGTHTQYGLIMAQQVFANNARRSYVEDGETKYSQRIVIIFTDGDTDSDEDTCIAEAYKLKSTAEGGYGATVYTVSMLSSESSFLDYLSSNFPTLQSTPENSYEAVYNDGTQISTSETYYVRRGSGYRAVNYGTYTNTTTYRDQVYESQLDTTKTYYINLYGNSYTAVQYGEVTSTTYDPVEQSAMKTDGSESYVIAGNYGNYTNLVYNTEKQEWGYYTGIINRTWNALQSGTQVYKVVETTSNGWYYTWLGEKVAVDPYDSANTGGSHQFYSEEKTSSETVTGWYYESDGSYTAYIPKTSAEDSTNTQFYKYNEVTSSSDKYYNNVTDMSKVTDIFSEIVKDAISSSSSVTLNADSYMQDVLNDGFVLPSDFANNISSYVTVTTKVMTTTDGSKYSEGAATETSKSLTVTALSDGVRVSGFDYSSKYVTTDHAGEILKVQIRGILPTDEAVTNAAIATNKTTSGIYSSDNTLSCAFPVPKTILTSKSYVIDYAKPFTVEPVDWSQDSITEVTNAFKSITDTNDTFTYGSVTHAESGITYTPNTMNWSGTDNLYVFGTDEAVKTDVSLGELNANANGNIWSKISVIPANSVYYEDSFATSTSTGVVGIAYGEGWTKGGNGGSNSEVANTPIHGGWADGGLKDDQGASDGTYMAAADGATASFTFTGTGADIYSYTSQMSGIVNAKLYDMTSGSAVLEKSLVVDTNSVSGETDGDTGVYYQIPTLSFTGLDHGTYKVELTVKTTSVERSTYYLDGVRVYNPLSSAQEADSTVSGAYGDEVNAVFTEVRDILLANVDRDPDTGYLVFPDDKINGVVFIDKIADATGTQTNVISDYYHYGPKNEVYLGKAGQSIAFNVKDASAEKTCIGLKAIDGTPVTLKVTNGDSTSELTISHASDLYYEITPSSTGYIKIEYVSGGTLGITKIKQSGATLTTSGVSEVNVNDLMAYVNEFDSLPVVEYVSDEATTVTPEVEITNPNPMPTVDYIALIRKMLNKIFDGFRGWFEQ